MTILLKNGTVIDYKTNLLAKKDILIENDKIMEIKDEINSGTDKVIDCTNFYIMPGMIDIHCHLREPGFEYKETIETGSKSAVSGGFTTICPMPNTKPTPDSAIILQKIFETALSAEIMNLVDTGDITHSDLVKLTSYQPAQLLKIDRGSIEVGKVADITIFAPNERYTYTKEMIVSKSKNSPFIGKKLKGRVQYAIVGGEIV